MKAIVIGSTDIKTDSIPFSQLFPFFDNRQCLRRELGFEFKHVDARSLKEIEAASLQTADAYFVRPCWRENPSDVTLVMEKFRDRQPNALIVFIDPFDQTSSRFFGVLPYVDRFLKYQRLKDVSQYLNPLKGGTVLTDYLVNELGYDIKDWSVQSEVPAGYESRIETGWFVTLTKRFQEALFHKPMFWNQGSKKSIDVVCHVSYGPRNNLEWYGQHRMLGVEALKRMASDYTLSVSGEFSGEQTISSRQYLHDLKRSRIAFSPFGWGEITWRDYEAACHGCLLIKPLVDHIDVEPNIFIPGKTYVPVRWDFADLEEKCRYYLANPDEAEQIAHNAREAYRAYFTENKFVHKIEGLIRTAAPLAPLEAETILAAA
ncbi:glycosyltransferase [Leptolyngbya sp. FACHB-711]|uniref:glycosyltransferase n=1 Tax=unclassified Leptolyngbya TaxID=2650499 RepID=UPI0016849FB3|nr:glycosyltransferase [Leptolyngbya sp. FACHB-711]MBD1848774.1 glycosyltransferase family 1 protein [Cyanobacteria bacterium FACHB-502]MBD2026843.1 glycosyltransferase family 1 protein [Leptolyngbya sp. FACHB-711]